MYFKKALSCILAAIMACSLIACNNADDTNDTSNINSLETEISGTSTLEASSEDCFIYDSVGSLYGLTEVGMEQTVLIIPETVTSIRSTIFAAANATGEVKVETIIFLNPDLELSANLLSNLQYLETVILPANITAIPGSLFAGCTSLTTFEIPSTVTEIGDAAFYNCENLVSITGGENVTFIGLAAFLGDVSLEEYPFTENIETIDVAAFEECESLTVVDLSSTTITAIEESAFSGCTSLHTVLLPNTLEIIYMEAFSYTESLVNLSMPEDVDIVEDAFLESGVSPAVTIFITEVTDMTEEEIQALLEESWVDQPEEG